MKDSQNVFIYQGTGLDYTNGLAGQDNQFKGRVSLVPGGLQAGNGSVIISNVTRKDSGEYKCILLQLNPLRQLTRRIQLIVGTFLVRFVPVSLISSHSSYLANF